MAATPAMIGGAAQLDSNLRSPPSHFSKLCRFFVNGSCLRGSGCPYMHPPEALHWRSAFRKSGAQSSSIVMGQMFKTKMCADNKNGKCCRGDGCPYAHCEREVRPCPDLRKTKMCSLQMAGKCCNISCPFAHSPGELRITCGFPEYKTRFCRFDRTSLGCKYGMKCRFAHGSNELRPPSGQDSGSCPSQSLNSFDFNGAQTQDSSASPASYMRYKRAFADSMTPSEGSCVAPHKLELASTLDHPSTSMGSAMLRPSVSGQFMKGVETPVEGPEEGVHGHFMSMCGRQDVYGGVFGSPTPLSKLLARDSPNVSRSRHDCGETGGDTSVGVNECGGGIHAAPTSPQGTQRDEMESLRHLLEKLLTSKHGNHSMESLTSQINLPLPQQQENILRSRTGNDLVGTTRDFHGAHLEPVRSCHGVFKSKSKEATPKSPTLITTSTSTSNPNDMQTLFDQVRDIVTDSMSLQRLVNSNLEVDCNLFPQPTTLNAIDKVALKLGDDDNKGNIYDHSSTSLSMSDLYSGSRHGHIWNFPQVKKQPMAGDFGTMMNRICNVIVEAVDGKLGKNEV